MPRLLKDLWIITENGVVVFSRAFDQKINPQLFGALMSALNTFAQKLSDGGISNFEMSNIRFVIVKRRDFLFVGSSLNKVKEKKVIDELKVISDKFFEVYNDVLLTWDNDVSIFSEFSKYIDYSTEKEATDKLREAFW
ncbi:MAG: hypothetical protein EAX89_05280 [Candidatus Lokiarchaeota archaeon]|nr:hypothetical protein [Candidatus Lokiarchaeota archaeon]